MISNVVICHIIFFSYFLYPMTSTSHILCPISCHYTLNESLLCICKVSGQFGVKTALSIHLIQDCTEKISRELAWGPEEYFWSHPCNNFRKYIRLLSLFYRRGNEVRWSQETCTRSHSQQVIELEFNTKFIWFFETYVFNHHMNRHIFLLFMLCVPYWQELSGQYSKLKTVFECKDWP